MLLPKDSLELITPLLQRVKVNGIRKPWGWLASSSVSHQLSRGSFHREHSSGFFRRRIWVLGNYI